MVTANTCYTANIFYYNTNTTGKRKQYIPLTGAVPECTHLHHEALSLLKETHTKTFNFVHYDIPSKSLGWIAINQMATYVNANAYFSPSGAPSHTTKSADCPSK